MAVYSPEQLGSMLSQIFDPRRILVRPIDLIAYASDASFYRLIPKAVVQAASEEEVARLFQFSHDHSLPITFPRRRNQPLRTVHLGRLAG